MPWEEQFGFRYKCMRFQYSCFPCCVQMIMRNLDQYRETDEIEEQWDGLQKQAHCGRGLDDKAPNEIDIHRDFLATDLRSTQGRIITHSFLEKLTPERAAVVEAELGELFATHRGLVIGVEHACLIFRANGFYVYVNPGPTWESCQIMQYPDLQTRLIQEQGVPQSYALQVFDPRTQESVVVGTTIVFLRLKNGHAPQLE
jgi:hypothetical protein